jgi:predicted metal-dependent HD superfamily phosphohydrolase
MPLIDDDIKDRLKGLYEGRAYHNWTHIVALLGLVDEYKQLVSDREVVEAAIYFHDAIYDSRDKDNEERSASLALDWLQQRTTGKRLASIAAAILATKNHAIPEGLAPQSAADTQFLIDADLSILGANHDEFDIYDKGIRDEYSWVSDHDWKVGRAAVFKKFLGRPQIFQLKEFKDRFEEQARTNLRLGIQKLEN